jgi:hypothetical protein
MKNAKKNSRPQIEWPKSDFSEISSAEEWAMSVAKPNSGRAESTVFEPFLVNEETAARMLGLGTRTVWQLGEDEALQIRRIGRRKLYLVSSLKAFAENGKGVE